MHVPTWALCKQAIPEMIHTPTDKIANTHSPSLDNPQRVAPPPPCVLKVFRSNIWLAKSLLTSNYSSFLQSVPCRQSYPSINSINCSLVSNYNTCFDISFLSRTQVILCNPFCFVVYLGASWQFFKDRIWDEEISLIHFFRQNYIDYHYYIDCHLLMVLLK